MRNEVVMTSFHYNSSATNPELADTRSLFCGAHNKTRSRISHPSV